MRRFREVGERVKGYKRDREEGVGVEVDIVRFMLGYVLDCSYGNINM